MKRILRAVGMAMSITLLYANAAYCLDAPPVAPFDKALLATSVPTDRREADVLVEMLYLRERHGDANALQAWLLRQDVEALEGRPTEQVTVEAAIHSPRSSYAELNGTVRSQVQNLFPVDFTEVKQPEARPDPEGLHAFRVAPGITEWLTDRHGVQFDVLVRVANLTPGTVRLSVSWVLDQWAFQCDEVSLASEENAIVTCRTNSTTASPEGMFQRLRSMKDGGLHPSSVSRDVIAKDGLLMIRTDATNLLSRSDGPTEVRFEAERRIAAAPAASLSDESRRTPAAEAGGQGNPYGALFIFALIAIALLIVRLRRGRAASEWLMLPWTLYALAGIGSIALAIVDPVDPNSGDGMWHGVIGGLLQVALGAPWSFVIIQFHGKAAIPALLSVAVLFNIGYAALFVFTGDKER